MAEKLTREEIEERADILRRFRQALLRQRERFSRYLHMLEEQPDMAASQDPGAVQEHVDIEKAIVREIATFEQVIDPLEAIYREQDPSGAADLPQLRAALVRTREEVVRRTEINRDILKAQITSIRREISGLRMMARQRSAYAPAEPSTVDISA